jgi:3D (Asp-Asp-Asp) domain-containing protein
MIAEAVFVATAYSWGCGAGSLTRLESPPKPFVTVAVDPTIIPLGSMVEIEAPFLNRPGRVWMAEDTGPDIVGNRIDIMVSTCEQARWWGRREVKVRIRKDHPWHRKLSKQHAQLAERLVSIRGSANLRARLSSVSSAEARAATSSDTSLLRVGNGGVASRVSLDHAAASSLLEWARRASQ